MKKKLLYIAVMIICLSIITGGTFAYFTTSDTARNVITTGGVEVKVVEQQLVNGTCSHIPASLSRSCLQPRSARLWRYKARSRLHGSE